MVQAWFAGVHGNVGGEYADTGLSDIAFSWIQEKASASGLGFDEDYLKDTIRPNYLGELRNSRLGFYTRIPAVIRQIGCVTNANEMAHASGVERMRQMDYRPPNLKTFLDGGGPITPDVPARPTR
jgi:Uncharacterized alpha/beta hydrolase domain (DUF2235)